VRETGKDEEGKKDAKELQEAEKRKKIQAKRNTTKQGKTAMWKKGV
jgi:hypothetical protein